MKEPRTDLGALAFLLSIPFRILGFMVRETADGACVAMNVKWRGPDGKTHWRQS